MLALVGLVLVVPVGGPAVAGADEPELYPLRSADGVAAAYAYAVDNDGRAVGQVSPEGSRGRAVYWDSAHRAHDLPMPPGPHMSSAEGLNNRGAIVGYMYQYDASGNVTNQSAVMWNQFGNLVRLARSPDATTSTTATPRALDINDNGLVVGRDDVDHPTLAFNTYRQAVYWDQNLGIHPLETLDTEHSAAVAVNNAGTIVGQSRAQIGGRLAFQAVYWDQHRNIHQLENLPGGQAASALDIAENGVIVGHAENADRVNRPVYWDTGGNIHELAALTPTADSVVDAINSQGYMTGRSTNADGAWQAVYWDPDGGLHPLDHLDGHHRSWAHDINDNGVIVGHSLDALSSTDRLPTTGFTTQAPDPSEDIIVNSTADASLDPDGFDCDTGERLDDGDRECTLRAALELAQGIDGANITFDISASSVPVISPASPLPPIVRPAAVDGTTQPGSETVVIDSNSDEVLSVQGGTSEIRGLTFQGEAGIAIVIDGGSDHVIEQNRFGTDPTGTASTSPAGSGVVVAGGTGTEITGNVFATEIGATSTPGASGTVIRDNAIGVTADGDTALGDPLEGMWITGPDVVVEDNTIRARNVGVAAVGDSARNVLVAGNRIGVSADGAVAFDDAGYAVRVDGASEVSVIDNMLSTTRQDAAVMISGRVQISQRPGPDGSIIITWHSPYGTGSTDELVTGGAVTVSDNTIGTLATGPVADHADHGITVWSGARDVTISDNTVDGTPGTAVDVMDSEQVQVIDNRIGSSTGSVGHGIVFTTDSGEGEEPDEPDPETASRIVDNVVTSPAGDGIGAGAAGTLVETNTITEAAGAAITAGATGVRIEGNEIHEPGVVGVDVVGDGITVEANTIVESGEVGIGVTGDDNHVTGNTITDAGDHGIVADGEGNEVVDNTVTDAGAGGIASQGDDNSFADNTVTGTDGPGLAVVGDDVAVTANTVHGNANGIQVAGEAVQVAENLIGVRADGTVLGNAGTGLLISSGDVTARENQIAASGAEGIEVEAGATANLRANRIWKSQAQAIDTASGPPAPTVVAMRSQPGQADRITLLVSDLPAGAGRIEVFDNPSCDADGGQAERVLGITRTKNADLAYQLVQIVEPRSQDHFTVTYTTEDGSTSALSECASATVPDDSDGDGSPDPLEELVGTEGDPTTAVIASDSEDLIGVSIVSADAAAGQSARLENVGPADDPTPDGHPEGWALAYGALGFRVTGLEPGGEAKVRLFDLDPAASFEFDAYWKYGPPSVGAEPTWFEFDWDPDTFTGAVTETVDIPGVGLRRTVVLNLADGQRGDSDGGMNMTITDPGGPVIYQGQGDPDPDPTDPDPDPTDPNTPADPSDPDDPDKPADPSEPPTPGDPTGPDGAGDASADTPGEAATDGDDTHASRGDAAATGSGSDGELPRTGGDPVPMTMVGIVAILVGMALITAGRRRRRHHSAPAR